MTEDGVRTDDVAMTDDVAVEVDVAVVESRDPEGLGFLLKARESGRLYRVRPARDPRQPRFWCVLVFRCSPAGVPEPDERPWFGAGGIAREELPDVLRAIRADASGWLAQDQCRHLRRWLLTPAPEPVNPPVAVGAVRGRATPRAVPVGAPTPIKETGLAK